ncbi:hypothetical protein MJA45_22665 [Paenibacillus aurantius]|uniref:Uncharacterized protein n=1 Tax=Paenibacillus aurantius TaxID=2918900 RepID=A0AA96LEZ1_9BACL|nr:hypothetical protein [Paenibacillus aurantius]WNQ10397.1 hypothetical protein MJA45_22665 [Paenibacillus aurantius]
MKRNGLTSCASLELLVSMLVEAQHKIHAKDLAEFKLNSRTIQWNIVELVDRERIRHSFHVDEVKHLEWFHVEPAEYSQRYRVGGRMELSLSRLPGDDMVVEPWAGGELLLPRSILNTRPVLTIPTSREHVLIQVRRQLLKWVPERSRDILPVSALY